MFHSYEFPPYGFADDGPREKGNNFKVTNIIRVVRVMHNFSLLTLKFCKCQYYGNSTVALESENIIVKAFQFNDLYTE